MKTQQKKRHSIAFKLAVVFAISILIQSAFSSLILIVGGVVKQTEKNAFAHFSETVVHRKAGLESEMQYVWTNFDQYTQEISEYYTLYGKNQEPDELLTNVAPYLREALGATKTTGIFFILAGEEKEIAKKALYLRNMDPTRGVADPTNLSMVAGPWAAAKKLNIVTNDHWSLRLQMNKENRDLYEKPYKSRELTEEERFVGYWCPPFLLTSGDEPIITYSLPLQDQKGNFIGVFGVEISLNYLYRYLPSSDLQVQDGYGYIIAMRTEEEENLYPIIVRESLQSRNPDLNHSLSMEVVDQTEKLYKVNGEQKMYACAQKLGLYYNNTPFESEEWYLVGLMNEDVLLHFSHKITHILLVAFFISSVGGLFIAMVISRWFTKPIIQLAEQVKHSDVDQTQSLQKTGLAEIDQLSEMIHMVQERLREERDQDPLTGICNRNAFYRGLTLYNGHLTADSHIGIGMFDLNGLKMINDRWGHEKGDQYLCVSCDIICNTFSSPMIFRIGGDEFVAIFLDQKEEDIKQFHETMIKKSKERGKELGMIIEIAFGYSFYDPALDQDLETVVARADANMYKNKRWMKEHLSDEEL